MPKVMVNGTNLFYINTASNHTETIVFSHGFLFNHKMFEAQIDYFQDQYRCVAYDHRGQGNSDLPKTGYDIDSITRDAIALIEQLNLAPCHFVGLSMGGYVGLRLALRNPQLLSSLTLIDSAGGAESLSKRFQYRLLAFIAQLVGTRPVVDRIMEIMFGQTFLTDSQRKSERHQWREHLSLLNAKAVWQTMDGAVLRESILDSLSAVTVPTLIVVGDEDVALPIEKSRRMHQQIRGSELVILSQAGHTPTIETPIAINRTLDQFLEALKHE